MSQASPGAQGSAVRAEAIQALRRQLKLTRDTRSRQQCVPTGIEAIDSQLPDGGLPTAAVIEWISEEAGLSAASMALRSVIPMLAQPGCLAVIDERHEFNADAAQSLGVPLSRILLVRPQPLKKGSGTLEVSDKPAEYLMPESSSPLFQHTRRSAADHSEALWALEQAARCPGVRVVLTWLDQSSTAVMRRLQLAVERSGVTVILIRPSSVLRQPSFADLRLHVQTGCFNGLNSVVRAVRMR